ncbi:hypothetical protein [Cohnella nanjingensis]|uniref:Uncharacterized protein n=1 Tax=Cohnella nanjingensis TaxID=1387779 RepID=A0A7X0RQ69_9BACL|nr:hypothetical protein [Cohnella nanjingensis]MBB6670249.1 hypothetical protein [Cohnella nanjingensis]
MIRHMRSSLGGHFAGTGIYEDPEDQEEMQWKRDKAHVRLPSDSLDAESLSALSGPVIAYNIFQKEAQ